MTYAGLGALLLRVRGLELGGLLRRNQGLAELEASGRVSTRKRTRVAPAQAPGQILPAPRNYNRPAFLAFLAPMALSAGYYMLRAQAIALPETKPARERARGQGW